MAISCVYYVKAESSEAGTIFTEFTTPAKTLSETSSESSQDTSGSLPSDATGNTATGPKTKNIRITNLNVTVRPVIERGNGASYTIRRNKKGSFGASVRRKLNIDNRKKNNVQHENKKEIAFKNGKTSIRKLN